MKSERYTILLIILILKLHVQMMSLEATVDYNPTLKSLCSELLGAISYMAQDEVSTVKKAIKTAINAHEGQYRMSGEPYVCHPIQVALIMATYQLPMICIISGLLHDTIEDAGIEFDDLAEEFSEECAELVDGVTKFAKDKFRDAETKDRQIESIRKMFHVMQNNIKIPVIKIFDRLDNARSFNIFREDKKIRLAEETLHIHVKLAEILLMTPIAEELKKISFGILYPEETRLYLEENEKYQRTLQRTCEHIHKAFPDLICKIDTNLFAGALIKNHGTVFASGMQDTFISCIVDTEKEAYELLNKMHEIYEPLVPVEDTLQEYGHQRRELITKIRSDYFSPCFVHITTRSYNEHNRFGIMSDLVKKKPLDKHETLSWIPNLDQLCELNQENSAIFWNELHASILAHKITVFLDKHKNYHVVAGSNVLETLLLTHTEDIFSISEVYINQSPVSALSSVIPRDFISYERNGSMLIKPEDILSIKTSLGRKLLFQQINTISNSSIDLSAWREEMLRCIFIYESLSSNQTNYHEWLQNIMRYFNAHNIVELYKNMPENVHAYDILVRMAYEYRPKLESNHYTLFFMPEDERTVNETADAIEEYYRAHNAIVENRHYHSSENGTVVTFTVNRHQTYTYGALIKMLSRFDLVEFSITPFVASF